MSDMLLLGGSVVVGAALSVVMFGGLWWTLCRLPAVRWPQLFALVSFWGRLAITVAGFYLVTVGDWRRGSAALIGFLIGRTILMRMLGSLRPSAAPKGA